MAESQRIQREWRGKRRDLESLRPTGSSPPTRPHVLRESDAPVCRPLDGAANFAPMAALTTPGTPAPVPLEVAASARARRRGLLGRDGIDGALLLSCGRRGAHPGDAVRDRRRLYGPEIPRPGGADDEAGAHGAPPSTLPPHSGGGGRDDGAMGRTARGADHGARPVMWRQAGAQHRAAPSTARCHTRSFAHANYLGLNLREANTLDDPLPITMWKPCAEVRHTDGHLTHERSHQGVFGQSVPECSSGQVLTSFPPTFAA